MIQVLKMILILLLISQSCIVSAKTVTIPINHMKINSISEGHLQTQSHLGPVIYHNMRSFQNEHLRHVLHFAASKEEYPIRSHGYFFTLDIIVDGFSYSLNIDTGSSDFFIKGQQSKGNPKLKYSCPECLNQNPKMQISYLDGSLQTYLQQMDITFGKHEFKENILVAYTAPLTFQKPEGLIGLSFPGLAVNPSPTFIQTLINNKIIDVYAFGVNINFQNNHSSISFGEPDSNLFEGKLFKTKLISPRSYKIKIDAVRVGQSSEFALSSALLDSGTSCISVPAKFNRFILDQFNKGGNRCGYDTQPAAPTFSLLRCRVQDFDQLPSIKIYINQTLFEVDKDAYVQRCVWDGIDSLCDFYIQSVKYQSYLFLGDGFFSRYYTYFDLANHEIGIAKNKEKLSYKNMYNQASSLDSEDRQFFKNL